MISRPIKALEADERLTQAFTAQDGGEQGGQEGREEAAEAPPSLSRGGGS